VSRLAAEAPAWQTWLPTLIGVVIVAAGGLVGNVWVKRLNRRVDDATADKSMSESRKASAETVSVEVATARGLIAEIQAMMDRQKAEFSAKTAEQTEQIKSLAERMSANEEQQRALRAAFASHETWDRDAVAALRTGQPDWPDPPPVVFD
jgi:hypothetical protein